MTAAECLQLLREVKDVAFATVDAKGHPQVRIIDVMLVDQDTFYFCTSRGKSFYRELMDTGHAAVTGMNSEFKAVRVGGRVKRLEEQKYWIDRIFAANPAMNAVYPGDTRYVLEAFCMAEGQMELFDLGKTPVFRKSFTIGAATEVKKGFVITEDCIGCNACRQNCPQQCIHSGKPYQIEQEHCLHCGLCREICPAEAIESRENEDDS